MGDTFKLGQSSRLYILGGPPELMPEEGLSKAQRQQMRALQARTHPVHDPRMLDPAEGIVGNHLKYSSPEDAQIYVGPLLRTFQALSCCIARNK